MGRGRGRGRAWESMKQRLRFKVAGCCGSPWGLRSPNRATIPDEVDEQEVVPYQENREVEEEVAEVEVDNFTCRIPEEMNLAMALAAERQLRAAAPWGRTIREVPMRVSLMRLFEEGNEDTKEEEEEKGGWVCCVCMGRRKGAAFVPCGHAFCRVCAKELWLNRGSCPLCNRAILEILDIF